jgi:hypothetical protein
MILLVTAAHAAGPQPGSLPDRAWTPGDAISATVTEICTPGYTRKVRRVSSTTKRRVLDRYGRTRQPGICCEIDHLIPLELGGSNRTTNLWAEPYDITWNAHTKDVLERALHDRVCSGELSLADAQKAIATNWIDAWRQFCSSDPRQHCGIAMRRRSRHKRR